jgi:F0F1-type ATP synthase alpha subunit
MELIIGDRQTGKSFNLFDTIDNQKIEDKSCKAEAAHENAQKTPEGLFVSRGDQ